MHVFIPGFLRSTFFNKKSVVILHLRAEAPLSNQHPAKFSDLKLYESRDIDFPNNHVISRWSHWEPLTGSKGGKL